jgi:hypothetical protein
MAAFDSALYMFDRTAARHPNVELLKRAHEHSRALLEAYEKYRRSKYWPCQGLLLAKVSEIEKLLGLEQEAARHLKKADDILTVSYGGNVLRMSGLQVALNGVV